MIKKTYIPGKPRNPKLSTATGTSGVGKTEFNQVAGSSHEHYNKGVLDQITEAMLVAALRDLITSTDTESELTDENMLSSLRVLSEIAKNNEAFLEELKNQFLSKINPDTAQKLITFTEGIEVGDFTTGALGAGAAIKMIDGTSFAEVDHLTVRQKATFRELIIEALKHIGGQLVLTPARMKCVRVVDGGSFYKCYFDTGDGEVSNEFVEGDLARCQVFTGNGTKFYWRLVTLVGEDWINLSKTSAAVGSDVPEAGDDIVQLGNATDTTRQSAIILSTVGVDAPSWKQYSGINSFSLEGKETTVFSKLGNKIEGKTVFTSGGTNLDDHLDGVAQDILDALQAAQDAEDKAQQAIEDAEANVGLINAEVGKLQAQLDGEVSNWFYPYSPTLVNYPASDWTTNEIKDRHIGDTFTNTQTFVDNATTPDAGKSWRFVKNGSTYSWTAIADSDAVKALLEASKAQATADGKSTTHLFQPTKYKLGDMWVLNADQTVNGTAYKQGDILTAIQDSETFNEAHWLKRVRYTDDTAVNNLEIGGRNYFSVNDFVADNKARGYNTIEVINYNGNIAYRSRNITNNNYVPRYLQGKFEANTQYYLQFKINWESYTDSGAEYIFRVVYTDGTSSNLFARTSHTSRSMLTASGKTIDYITTTRQHNGTVVIYEVQIEKSNKASDWKPAPEDVEANIAAAKTEAENAAKAYADTKAEAERVIAEAYADGKVSAEEQARIDDVNAKLAAAKDYADAQDALLKIQQEAYADGKASEAELAAIAAAEAYANLKKTEAEAYADGKVSAEEAARIADAEAKLQEAKDHAAGLVNNIRISGRNLLLNTNRKIENSSYRIAIFNLGTYKPIQGETVTIAFKGTLGASKSYFGIFNSNDSTNLTYLYPYDRRADGVFSKTFQWNIGGSSNDSVHIFAAPISPSSVSSIEDVMLVVGNKIAYYSEAPEDIQEKINTAKQEALTAASNAQGTADSLKNFTDKAFRDGIIDRSESAAIEKYKNSLNETMSKAEASYMKVFLNTYLEGAAKTDLELAKINLWGQRDTLLSAINTAISGGTTTPAQKTAVDNAFSTFNNLMAAFQNALEEANKAIQNKLDARSTEKVNNIQMGGRNLLIGSTDEWKTVNAYSSQVYINLPFSETKLEAGQTYVFSWETELLSGSPSAATQVTIGAGTTSYQRDIIWTSRRIIGKQYRVFTPTEYQLALGNSFMMRWYTNNEVFSFRYRKLKLEKGNKPSADWSPAIEDVDKKISDAAAKAQALEYLKQAIGQDAVVDGALYTLVTLLLKENMNADVTAGISGIRGAGRNLPAFWAGGTDIQAQQGTAKAIIRHDGSSKFTDTEITGVVNALSGSIGDLNLHSGKLSSYDPLLPIIPLGNHIQLSKNEISIRSLSSGNPQILTEASIKNSLITVKSGPLGGPYNSTEIKPDGIYKNGVKVL